MWRSLKTWFRGEQAVRSSRRIRPSFRPSLEAFEERLVLSTTFVVTDVADASQALVGTNHPKDTNGLISLRSAIGAAEVDAAHGASDLIQFSSSMKGDVLSLTQGAIELTAGKGMVTVAGGNNITFNGNNSCGFFQCDSGSHSTIQNTTFEDGCAYDGGAFINHGCLTVNNCTFDYNSASDSGGAIYNDGNLNACHSTFYGNCASYDGGAIFNSGSLSVSYCNFDYNYADYGGAIYNDNVASTCNSSFYGNDAYYDGGAIFNSGALSSNQSTFKYNYAYQNGGAIASEGSYTIFGGSGSGTASLKLCSCCFSDNSAYDGGAIYYSNSTFSANNLTFSGNTATDAGGSIYHG